MDHFIYVRTLPYLDVLSLLVHTASSKKVLKNCQVDVLPRCEAFWFRGGFYPDRRAVLKDLGRNKAIDAGKTPAHAKKKTEEVRT